MKNRKNIIISVLLPAILVAIILAGAILYIVNTNENTKKQTYDILNGSAKEQIRTLGDLTDGNITVLQIYADEVRIHDKEKDILSMLNEIVKTSLYSHVCIAGENGKGFSESGVILDVSDIRPFKEAMKGNVYFERVEKSRLDNNEYITVAVPIIREGKPVGMVNGYLEESILSSRLAPIIFNENAYSLICDSDGEILLKSKQGVFFDDSNNFFEKIIPEILIDDDVSIPQLKDSFKKGGSGIISYTYKGNDKYAVYMPSGINDWLLLNIVDKHVADKYLEENQRNSILLFVIIIICGIILAMYIFIKERMRVRERENAREREIIHYSTDELTGLYNNNGFLNNAAKAVKTVKNDNYYIISFDVWCFSAINMLYGTVAGDAVLKDIAYLIKAKFGEKVIAARIYADNFAILAQGKDIQDILNKTKILRMAMPEMVREKAVFGIYEVKNDGISVRTMLEYAKEAKLIIKDTNEYVGVYDRVLQNRIEEENEFIISMDDALVKNEFVVYYQPKYSAKTEKIVAAEALVRWRKPDGTLIMPGRFVPLFERRGLIAKLDYYVFNQVCQKLASLIQKGIEPVDISVNFSKVHFREIGFAQKLFDILDSYKIPASMIEIEFTESAFAEDIELVNGVVNQIKSKGFKVSMDDFGSDYSSLKLLKDISFDILKIDRCFLDYVENEKAEIILKNIIGLAKQLKLTTVIEGVETKEQMEFVKAQQCDIIQGYYFSKPVKEDVFEELLKK